MSAGGGGSALASDAVAVPRDCNGDSDSDSYFIFGPKEPREVVVPTHPPCKKDEGGCYIYEKDKEELEAIVQRVVQTAKTLEVGTPIRRCSFNICATSLPSFLLSLSNDLQRQQAMLSRETDGHCAFCAEEQATKYCADCPMMARMLRDDCHATSHKSAKKQGHKNVPPQYYFQAAKKEKETIVSSLELRAAHGVDRPGPGGATALIMLCAEKGRIKDIQTLLDIGKADINKVGYMYDDNEMYQPKKRCSPLHTVLRHGNVELVVALLDFGAKVNEQICISKKTGWSADYITALQLAVERRDDGTTVMELLLDKGADPNAPAQNPALKLVVEGGTFDSIAKARLLLSRGADPNLCSILHDTIVPIYKREADDDDVAYKWSTSSVADKDQLFELLLGHTLADEEQPDVP